MTTKRLHKLTLRIDAEAEEPVSALMERLFAQSPVIHFDLKTRLTTASVFLDDPKLVNADNLAKFRNGWRTIRESGLSTGPARIRLTSVKHEDWAESWKIHFKPFEVGHQLLVRPSWSRKRPRKQQRVVVLDPGLSFGTGQHPTTRFCLRHLVRCRQVKFRQSFLDMGTGSGILAIAAAKLGYDPVEAFDFDAESVRIAHENARINGNPIQLKISKINIFDLPARSRVKFDVIAANLSDDILLANHRKIIGRLKLGGALILSGILRVEFRRVQRCFEEVGAKLVSSKREKEWRSGLFTFGQVESK